MTGKEFATKYAGKKCRSLYPKGEGIIVGYHDGINGNVLILAEEPIEFLTHIGTEMLELEPTPQHIHYINHKSDRNANYFWKQPDNISIVETAPSQEEIDYLNKVLELEE